MLLAAVLTLAGLALVTVGLLGWRGLLPRNRFCGIRTPASLRSDSAFRAANRAAGPPVVAAGAAGVTGGALCLAVTGGALGVVAGVSGAGTLLLALAGGVLGNRVAESVTATAPCGATGCTAACVLRAAAR